MNGTFTAPNQITLDRSDYALTDIKCIINQRTQATLYTITTPTAVGATLVGNLLTISNSTSQVGDVANIISKPVATATRWSPTQVQSVTDAPMSVEFGPVESEAVTGAASPYSILVGQAPFTSGPFISAVIPEIATFQTLQLRDDEGTVHFSFYNMMGMTSCNPVTIEAQNSGYSWSGAQDKIFTAGNFTGRVWFFNPYMMGDQTKSVTINPAGNATVSAINPRAYDLTTEVKQNGARWADGTLTPHFYIDTINPLTTTFTLTIGTDVYEMDVSQSGTALTKNGVAGDYWTDFGIVPFGAGFPNPYVGRIIIPAESPLASHFVLAANGTDLFFNGTISSTGGTIEYQELTVNQSATYKWEKVPTDELMFVDGVPQYDKTNGEYADADASIAGIPTPTSAGLKKILWSTPPDERTADAVSAPVTTTITGSFNTDDLSTVTHKDFNINFLGGTLCLQVQNIAQLGNSIDCNIQFSNDGINFGVPTIVPNGWYLQTIFVGTPQVQEQCLQANWYLSAGQSYFVQLDVSGYKYLRFLSRSGNFSGGARYDFVVSNAETQPVIPSTQTVSVQSAVQIVQDGALIVASQQPSGSEVTLPVFNWIPYSSNAAWKAKFLVISELNIPEGTSVDVYFGSIIQSGAPILAPCVPAGTYSGQQIDVTPDLTWMYGTGVHNYTGTYCAPMGAANKLSLVSGQKYFIDISTSNIPCRFLGFVKTGTGAVTMGGVPFDFGSGQYSMAFMLGAVYGAN